MWDHPCDAEYRARYLREKEKKLLNGMAINSQFQSTTNESQSKPSTLSPTRNNGLPPTVPLQNGDTPLRKKSTMIRRISAGSSDDHRRSSLSSVQSTTPPLLNSMNPFSTAALHNN